MTTTSTVKPDGDSSLVVKNPRLEQEILGLIPGSKPQPLKSAIIHTENVTDAVK